MQEAYRLQLRCFLGLVQEQRHLPSLKQLLKLYTAISLPKLASLMDLDEPTLRSQLILLKVPPPYSCQPSCFNIKFTLNLFDCMFLAAFLLLSCCFLEVFQVLS